MTSKSFAFVRSAAANRRCAVSIALLRAGICATPSSHRPTRNKLETSSLASCYATPPGLGLRSGAGPFRSLGRLSVRPRPCQFVPLIMALKLEAVRMLIADNVGVGKTIEAALIARELLV